MQGWCFCTRFADDFIIGFELETDARRVLKVLPKRFSRVRLTMHSAKTVVVECKKPPYRERSAHSKGTFDFASPPTGLRHAVDTGLSSARRSGNAYVGL